MTTQRFRLPYRHADCPDPYTRPLPAAWLASDRVIIWGRYRLRASYAYWTKVYWATPPWLTVEMITAMQGLYESRREGEHVDHIVPLKNSLVCGLHVPWNLQVMGARENLQKSNKWWPDHPFEQLRLI